MFIWTIRHCMIYITYEIYCGNIHTRHKRSNSGISVSKAIIQRMMIEHRYVTCSNILLVCTASGIIIARISENFLAGTLIKKPRLKFTAVDGIITVNIGISISRLVTCFTVVSLKITFRSIRSVSEINKLHKFLGCIIVGISNCIIAKDRLTEEVEPRALGKTNNTHMFGIELEGF